MIEDWKETILVAIYQEYKSKLRNAKEAVKIVHSDSYIQYNSFNGVPPQLDQALAERRDELERVIINCSMGLYPLHIASSDPLHQHFIYNSWHYSSYDRKMSNCYNVPGLYYEIPKTIRSRMRDVVMFQVAPMDQKGYFNFG